MPVKKTENDLILFSLAEKQAKDYALNNLKHPFNWHKRIEGLFSESAINKEVSKLKSLPVDDYIARALEPAEAGSRPSARNIVRKFRGKVHEETDIGPYYAVDMELSVGGSSRRVGILVQNRSVNNGVWAPEHHLEACRQVRAWAKRSLPIVTFMDTPGADAGQQANSANQAHSISRLIAEMTNAPVPTVGIIYGLGYSGGAIPLAATNVLLSVKTGVFNTIQPKGLASIARQYNLSWQESARYVGLSPTELFQKGVIDGVIDWSPEDKENELGALINAITSSIKAIEAAGVEFLASNKEVEKDYALTVSRAMNPKEKTTELERAADFKIRNDIAEFPSIFDHCMAYMRYLGLRSRISSSTVGTYGRLATEEIPEGDLSERQKTAREAAFDNWHN
ncbi:MAG: carboxyl transferase domain-containing protein, partial [Pseudomonadales bacterium]